MSGRRLDVQLERLGQLIERVAHANSFQRERLLHASIETREQLRSLPLTLRSELLTDQTSQPPFGTNISYQLERYTRVHVTSGTVGDQLRVPQTDEDWLHTRAQFALVLHHAGIGSGDRVALPFAFGPYLQFWAAVAGVEEIGALPIPLGGLGARERLITMAQLETTAVICTPSYAIVLTEEAQRSGLEAAFESVHTVICQGEPGASIAAARGRIETAWGARVLDHAGSTEVGVFTYPCAAGGGLHVNEDDFICEVVDPRTDAETAPGDQGEMVLTALLRTGYPLIRFRSGDIVEVGGACPAGHEHIWLPRGIVGRTDDLVVVNGMNIFPSAVEAILREVGVLGGYRIRRPDRTSQAAAAILHPSDSDEITVLVEMTEPARVSRIQDLARDRLGLSINVVAVMPGTLRDTRPKTRRLQPAQRSGA
ncbi:phenylacetate--CoA ligase family protein [Conexibacter sp. S30A1]|uniref:phenylacetate--CoA ligase family protein n=1 Tax=Conexibacter sp. S30A1 TaxID=2937800 RepID=UPI00200E1C79|nr:hypothetical protein [Conexibacter sp. S30A1]